MSKELILDELVASILDNDDELELGYHDMKIVKVSNNVNKNGLPYISITCEKDGKFVRVPYYFSDVAMEKSAAKLVKLSKKLLGGFTYKQNLDLDALCEVLAPCVGKKVSVNITQTDEFMNYQIV